MHLQLFSILDIRGDSSSTRSTETVSISVVSASR